MKNRLTSGRYFSYIFSWGAAFRLSRCTLMSTDGEIGQCPKLRSSSSPQLCVKQTAADEGPTA